MIEILGKIPNSVTVACSGGVDSMAVVDFLLHGKKDVTIAYFDHGTKHGKDAKKFVTSFCKNNNVKLLTASITSEKPKGKSSEEHWRHERYAFLNSISGSVITCHHLDDQIETWLFGALHGRTKLIPYSNKNVIRPFLTTKKGTLVRWCEKRNVDWILDMSNHSSEYMRNYIRYELLPHAFKVNPGLHKIIKKRVLEGLNEKV